MTATREIAGTTVMITGGAGFIGSHLVDRLIEEDAAHVVVIDNMFLGNEDNLLAAQATGRLSFYRDDAEFATNLDYIFQRHPIDTVFNCATKALNYSFMNPANAFGTNVTVVLNLLELQRRGAFKTLCHFSTSEVYGSAVYEPMDEKHPRNPTTTYAAGKAAADLAVESFVHMFGLDAFIVRPFNNYGPRQNHRGLLAGVIPITAWRILNNGTPEIHGGGQQSRDFIHVRDTVDAVVKLFSVLPSGESVNISTDNQVTIGSLVTRIATILNYKGEILRKPARAADVLCHNACNQKVHSLIDFMLTDFDTGLSETLDWYVNRFKAEK
jgi:UDP-glucose 4-epimerase